MEYVLLLLIIGVILWAFGSLLYLMLRGSAQQRHNSQQPVLRTKARLLTKKQDIWLDAAVAPKGPNASSTYQGVFENVESCEELTFTLSIDEYIKIEEGNVGILIYQGTRFLGFERDGHKTR